MVAENVWQELEAQLPMGSEFWPVAVKYRALVPAGGSVTVTGWQPEVAWKL